MTTLQSSAQAKLRQFVEQIERLDEERRALSADIRDKFKELQNCGFDVKTVKKVLTLRRRSAKERDEEDALLDVYKHALGMIGTPLGDWAANEKEKLHA